MFRIFVYPYNSHEKVNILNEIKKKINNNDTESQVNGDRIRGDFPEYSVSFVVKNRKWRCHIQPNKSGSVASGVTKGNHGITREWQINDNISSTE